METIYPGGYRPTAVRTAHRAAINGLAVVGFIALISMGIMLAIYSARFVPTAVSRIAAGAVYLSSEFTPAKPSLTAVSATTTIPFTEGTSTATSTETTPAVATSTKPVATTPVAGPKTTTTHVYPTTPAVVTPYGLSDLSVNLIDVGYLTNGNSDSFVASHVVPAGDTVALKFEIVNNGTNATGSWTFKAAIPTDTSYTYYADAQQSLAPGDRITYLLSFDRAKLGTDESIVVTADQDNKVTESNENNNTATAFVTVK